MQRAGRNAIGGYLKEGVDQSDLILHLNIRKFRTFSTLKEYTISVKALEFLT